MMPAQKTRHQRVTQRGRIRFGNFGPPRAFGRQAPQRLVRLVRTRANATRCATTTPSRHKFKIKMPAHEGSALSPWFTPLAELSDGSTHKATGQQVTHLGSAPQDGGGRVLECHRDLVPEASMEQGTTDIHQQITYAYLFQISGTLDAR
jgi:hypothetical protein